MLRATVLDINVQGLGLRVEGFRGFGLGFRGSRLQGLGL